ncbi:hypothetical protein C8P66_10392 [Humitalea rosea]|uniref:Uncharacterized protein n=1 Tax=Humitalea rosea TaxID=990373 RepID=A0A2W7IRG2_9PROT|nr:hypothetical protein [Humitalea rosea]PZW49066.1 hypothetical protein C8P66_10392 [Humitalea rosea]
MATPPIPAPLPRIIADSGKVRLGAGLRRQAVPAPVPASVRDSGRIRLGAGLRRI